MISAQSRHHHGMTEIMFKVTLKVNYTLYIPVMPSISFVVVSDVTEKISRELVFIHVLPFYSLVHQKQNQLKSILNLRNISNSSIFETEFRIGKRGFCPKVGEGGTPFLFCGDAQQPLQKCTQQDLKKRVKRMRTLCL